MTGPIAGQIRAFDRALGERPGVVLAPTAHLTAPRAARAITWHLLIADEALRYANPATDAHQALAQLRLGSVADCWLLTATPRGKSAEHLDVLVGLALGDEAMIRERLNTREAGDLMDELNAHRLRVNYGPHLVRVTRQDMQAWMPEVRPAQPLAVDPDAALAELLEAIRHGGREAYRRLIGLLARAADARARRRAAQAGAGRARPRPGRRARQRRRLRRRLRRPRDAPALQRRARPRARPQRSCRDAMRGGGDGLPLLRGITAQTIAGIAGEEQVLVFAERVRCLRQLAATLRQRHGVEAHVGDGSLTPRVRGDQAAFCAGEFPVLCLSRIGHEGHNFQTASTIVHLDLPWLQTGLEQRVGRAARPGAVRGAVQTVIPYIKRGGIEHVVSVLARRGAEHHQILDSFEGVAPPSRRSPRNSPRSPARSPKPRTTPATPGRPRGCGSPRASSAPDGPRLSRSAAPPMPLSSGRQSPIHHQSRSA